MILIRMPNSKTDQLLKSIETFWSIKDKYKQFGQLYKRGILLHGTQGTGKTTTIDLLFNQLLKRDGVVFIVEDPDLTIEAIRRFRNNGA